LTDKIPIQIQKSNNDNSNEKMNKRAFIPSLLLPVITILQAVGCFFSLAILFKQQKKDFRSTNSLNLHKEEEEGKEASRVHLEDLSLQVAALVGVVEVSTRKEQKKKRRKKLRTRSANQRFLC